MMNINVKLDCNAIVPCKAHKEDAGFDLFSHTNVIVKANDSCVIDTGVHVQIPNGYVGLLLSKSGLNIKHGILSDGVIDCGYTGPIKVKLYNHSNEDYKIEIGDKITQLVIMPIADCNSFTLVNDFVDKVGDRGNNGFGSTGR